MLDGAASSVGERVAQALRPLTDPPSLWPVAGNSTLDVIDKLSPLAVVIAAAITGGVAIYALRENKRQHEATLAADNERLDRTLAAENQRLERTLANDRRARWLGDARGVLAETAAVLDQIDEVVRQARFVADEGHDARAFLAAMAPFEALKTELFRKGAQLAIRFSPDEPCVTTSRACLEAAIKMQAAGLVWSQPERELVNAPFAKGEHLQFIKEQHEEFSNASIDFFEAARAIVSDGLPPAPVAGGGSDSTDDRAGVQETGRNEGVGE